MEDDEKLSYRRLHNRTYRSLQQLAKSLNLPSNFKKIYLIELIQAKKFKSQTEVDNIIHKVKLERLQISRAKRESRRMRLQILEKPFRDSNQPNSKKEYKYTELPSSSKICFSPPITQTPKRLGHMCIPYTEAQKSLLTYNPKRNLLQNLNQNPLPSDRVLRSFNMKTVKPNYALLSGQEMKPQTNSRETRIKIVTNGSFPQFNVTAKCVVKKHKPNILHNPLKRPLMLTQGPDLLYNPIKRQRTLSGIYPIIPETIPRDLHSTESVCLRKMDGSLTKLNAIVQKRNIDLVPRPKNNYRNTEIQIQDVVNTIDDTFTDNLLAEPGVNNNYVQIEYPNMSSLDTMNCNLNPQMSIENSLNDNLDMYSVYYHKKIRSEQIRCQKLREMQESDRLPRINDVFTKFNNVHRFDLTQPLYVHVSTESERSQSHPLYSNREQYNTIMLETVYNFKNQLLMNAPLLQVATTANTKLVYATPTVTTPIAQPSTLVSNDYLPSFEVDDHRHPDLDPRLYEFLQFPEQNPRRNYYNNEDFNTSTSSLETSQDLSTATIPEMVEDALEIISQDGDYMESIDMDIRVQCILCSWAGPRMLLEYHIRKEHACAALRAGCAGGAGARWRVALAAGGARLLRHGAALYVLRARTARAHALISLTSLSTEAEPKLGSITIYNRLSGEPFTWSGHIQPYFQCDSENCLKVELSRLNLLPNSANVKLVNGELVSEPPNKVVVGQSMLNDIHLVLYVKVFN